MHLMSLPVTGFYCFAVRFLWSLGGSAFNLQSVRALLCFSGAEVGAPLSLSGYADSGNGHTQKPLTWCFGHEGSKFRNSPKVCQCSCGRSNACSSVACSIIPGFDIFWHLQFFLAAVSAHRDFFCAGQSHSRGSPR